MSEENICCSDVKISPYTNKPITDGQVSSSDTHIKFRCGICKCLMKGVFATLQHLHGKSHKLRSTLEHLDGHARSLRSRALARARRAHARKRDAKFKRDAFERDAFKCDDCNKVFNTGVCAFNHFKGEKHIKTISSIAALAKQERKQQRKRDREFIEKRDDQRGGSGCGLSGYGIKRGSNHGISGNAGILSSQGDLHNRIGKFLHTKDTESASFNYGTPRYEMNNTSAPSDRYFTSMRGVASNGTLRRDAYDGIDQQDTYTRGAPANYFACPESPLKDYRPSNFGENLSARQNYHNESSPTQPSQLGGSGIGYYSNEYNVNNEIATNQAYGSYY